MASWNTSVNIPPDYGVVKKSTPRFREVQLGDGYVVAAKFGLNQDLKTWDLTFSNITESQSDVIENFLDAREGTEAFEWTPPNESYTSKYRCKTWSKTMPYSNLATIKATFEEVALP